MSLISLLVVLIVVGAILYLIQTVLPIDARIKQIIYVIVIVVVFLYVLQSFGLIDMPRLRAR